MAGTPRPSLLSASTLAFGMGVCALGAWSWQAKVLRAPRLELGAEPWDQVKHAYPIPDNVPDVSTLSTDTVEAILRANPFSPQRRQLPATSGSEVGSGPTAVEPPKPMFIYKGRINLGQRQRAIMEDVATKKTYFLEVGQEVATFKVLDITESQVLLSDPQTSEPVVVPLSSKNSEKKDGAQAMPSR